jgi:hypothetical protein
MRPQKFLAKPRAPAGLRICYDARPVGHMDWPPALARALGFLHSLSLICRGAAEGIQRFEEVRWTTAITSRS